MNTILSRFALLTIVAAAFAFSQPGPHPKMHNELKLTDAQQEQFEKISFDMRKKQIELKAKLETSQLELRRIMTADAFDKGAVEKKVNEIADQQAALRMNHINAWAEKNKVLNADQQKIWKKTLLHHPRAMKGKQAGRMMMMRERSMRDDDDELPEHKERRIEKKIIKE